MNNQQQLSELFNRYLENNCSEEEVAILLQYFGEQANSDRLGALILLELNRPQEKTVGTNSELLESTWKKIHKSLPSYQLSEAIPLQWYRRKWVQVAAVVLVLLSLGGIYLQNIPEKSAGIQLGTNSTHFYKSILPGSEKAILTLSDGSQLVLDDSANGVLATQGSSQIVKNKNGEISYANSNNAAGKTIFNTMQTPRGGQYRIVLPDGTKVWLNAASSIRYPVAFDQKVRRVEVKGEVYFEVAHDKNHPFIVHAGPASIQVLGTSFNINSYEDEPVQVTTLVEGSVRIEKNSQFSMLLPGQQARISQSNSISVQEAPDLEEVTAWKNGLFQFNGKDVQTIMRQISRWYDVEVAYQGEFNKETFSGLVSKTSSIDQVLKILEAGGVHFKLDGKKLIVMQ